MERLENVYLLNMVGDTIPGKAFVVLVLARPVLEVVTVVAVAAVGLAAKFSNPVFPNAPYIGC